MNNDGWRKGRCQVHAILYLKEGRKEVQEVLIIVTCGQWCWFMGIKELHNSIETWLQDWVINQQFAENLPSIREAERIFVIQRLHFY